MKKISKKSIFFFVLLSLLSFNLCAGELTQKEKAMFAQNVIIPLPSEILMALNKITDVDWSKTIVYNYTASYTENYKIALNIGVKTAYGFEAIQANDKKNIGEMFSITKTLASNFGGKKVFKDIAKIKEFVAKNEWKRLRVQLDKYQNLLQDEMEKYNPDFVILASVAGWIEGLKITTKALSSNYNAEASKLLHQPKLIESFITKLSKISKSNRNKLEVKTLVSSIAKIQELSNSKLGSPISEKNIKELYAISSKLVSIIEKEK